jgi:hypothetical protein
MGGAQIADDWNPKVRIRLLEHDAIVDLRDGKLDGLLAYLRDTDTENVPMSPLLREWLASSIDGDPPEIMWRLGMEKHPTLKHAPISLEECERESAKGIDAIVGFLNGGGLQSHKRGIGAAMDATGWGRTKVTDFISAWRIKRMRLAVELPQNFPWKRQRGFERVSMG